MSTLVSGSTIRQVDLGYAVYKTAFNLPQTTSTAIFTVAGGDVLITALYGQVTTLLVGAVSLNLTYTPSGGAATDLNAATVCDDDAVGTLYGLTGVVVDLMSCQKVGGTEVPNVTSVAGIRQGGLIVRAGAVNLKASASRVGQTKWTLCYVPLDDGASVVAA
jgi:hypothetical protein